MVQHCFAEAKQEARPPPVTQIKTLDLYPVGFTYVSMYHSSLRVLTGSNLEF